MVSVNCPHCLKTWEAKQTPIRCKHTGCKRRLPTGNPPHRPRKVNPNDAEHQKLRQEASKRTSLASPPLAPQQYGQRFTEDGKPLFSPDELERANLFKRAPRPGF